MGLGKSALLVSRRADSDYYPSRDLHASLGKGIASGSYKSGMSPAGRRRYYVQESIRI